MRRIMLCAAVCGGLAACVAPPPFGASTGGLSGARLACNERYPAKIGNYLPHALCVNAAIDSFALPGARHPELLRMQEDIRASLAGRVDRRQISLEAGRHKMNEADALVAEIQRDRDLGNEAAAARRMKALDAMLKRESGTPGVPVATGSSPPNELINPDSSSGRDEIQLGMRNGIFTVPVLINDAVKLDFLLDSGGTDVSIPEDVIRTLIRSGTVAEGDVIGMSQYVLADGSKHQGLQLRLRELRIGDRAINDVTASVAPMRGTLLLGQSFLTRFGSWTIDNRRRMLVLSP
jgi:clan AA aspartic protease (TIGR02281 family)